MGVRVKILNISPKSRRPVAASVVERFVGESVCAVFLVSRSPDTLYNWSRIQTVSPSNVEKIKCDFRAIETIHVNRSHRSPSEALQKIAKPILARSVMVGLVFSPSRPLFFLDSSIFSNNCVYHLDNSCIDIGFSLRQSNGWGRWKIQSLQQLSTPAREMR